MRRSLVFIIATLALAWGASGAAQAAPPRLRLDLERLVVQGSPDKQLLLRFFRRPRAALDRCFALNPDAPWKEEDALRMTLGRDVKLGTFTILFAWTPYGPEVNACLLELARTIQLPRSAEPCGLSQVTVPIRRRAAAPPVTP